MKKYILIILALCMVHIVFSQSENKIKEHHIGLYGRANSEKGFSFRYIPNKLGIQVTGVPMFSKTKRVFFSVGLSGLFTIQESKYAKVFSYIGGQYIESDVFVKSARFNMGGGLGLDTQLSQKIGVTTRGGYGILNITDRNTSGVFTAELSFNYQL